MLEITTNRPDLVDVGEVQVRYSARGDRVLSFSVELTHKVLSRHKLVTAPDLTILQHKLEVLLKDWSRRHEEFDNKTTATRLADDASVGRSRIRNLLRETLKSDDTVDWDSMKISDVFVPSPYPHKQPEKPVPRWMPPQPDIGFFDLILFQRKKLKRIYESEVQRIQEINQERERDYQAALTAYHSAREKWDQEQDKLNAEFNNKKREHNDAVETLQNSWKAGDTRAILAHANLVLEASDYPDFISKEFDISFDESRGIMVVDYVLPSPEQLPLVKSAKVLPSTGEISETLIPKAEQKELYDDLCYQLSLRTIHELLEADTHRHIKAVAFNGSVRSVNPATGEEIQPVIISVFSERTQFEALNLELVDPRACFKSLKGVSASTLIGLSPVPPVMKLDKNDRRFIEAKDIDLGDSGSVNLASIDWEDFEHFVRQVFEKEFATRGGEVKVTRASADGGVDAIAFDPDPISGGKIVIQAKRYTRTVGVSAVRDLFGTTQAEGANKGILVTTADFGPDAYKFAQGKPLTLLSGSNLLSLLEKHGIRARIDLAEARKELGLTTRD